MTRTPLSASFLSVLALSLSLDLTAAAAAQTADAAAVYDVTFEATWSAGTHPGAYPPAAHFSPLIGATHDAATHLWQPGGIASAGIESMAETGGTSLLSNEIDPLIQGGMAGEEITGNGIASPGITVTSFRVTDEHPRVTLVTMVAPSPDWFVGTDGLSLFENGQWVDEKVVPLLCWDAGSDSGTTFTAPNLNTSPKEPIALVTGGPFTGNDPLGTFTFRRRASYVEHGTCANPAGSLAIGAIPAAGGCFTIDVHDPGLSMPMPSLALLVVSRSPDPAYPCGTAVPGWGLSAPGATGELLHRTRLNTIGLPSWSGAPVSYLAKIPNDPKFVGKVFYAQGALVAPGQRVGLTTGLKMVVGP